MENDLIHRNTALAILRALREAVGNYAPVDDIDDAIDMIQNVNAVDAMPKWISAISEHPEDQAVVLIYCNDGEVGAARFEEEYGCFVTTEKGTWKGAYGAVTHWMPLPSAPKEGV